MRAIEITESDGILLAGLVVDGRLTDLAAERPTRPGLSGAVFLARVERVDRVSAAAFLDIGTGRSAFLPLRGPEADALRAGAPVMVQIIADPRGDKGGGEKGAEATRDIALPGATVIHLPFSANVAVSHRLGPAAKREWQQRLAGGWIVRAAAAAVPPDQVLAEAERLGRRWETIADRAETTRAPALLEPAPGAIRRLILDHPDVARIVVDGAALLPPLQRWAAAAVPELASRIAGGPTPLGDALDALLAPTVALPSGGSITIEATRALTAIDVDGGRSPDHLRTNREAAAEIARQLRLRNIGGTVVVDFISMRRGGDKAAILNAFRAALADDPLKVQLGEALSPLGLAELARERRGQALAAIIET
ncbi:MULTISPECIES: ribonuclease E/G [unclassified Inquilinus]|uniref:ribonuclease E/G n=1 Tax=unclassified Inquilinus TaxID=2645927 RepID=UPI003F936ED4